MFQLLFLLLIKVCDSVLDESVHCVHIHFCEFSLVTELLATNMLLDPVCVGL